MNVLDHTLWLSIAHRVGWTLIHSLWQLAAVAVLVMFALRLLQRAKPQTRYVVAGSGLLLMAFLPIISFVYFATAPDSVALDSELTEYREAVADRNDFSSEDAELHNDPVVSKATAEQHIARNHANLVTDSSSSLFESAEVLPTEKSTVAVSLHSTGNKTVWPAYFVTLMPWLTSVWLAGVFVFAAAHARGFFVVHRLSRLEAVESEQHLQHRMEALADRLGVRVAIRLLETARVNTPLVIGWFRPVILVPLGIVTGLSPVQLDAILLHELAHIRRHDYLVNTLQVLIETLLFYHPAVWWLSRHIRTEREYCCDDIAAAGCGSHLDLARALATLETARFGTPLALAASGPGKEKATMKRVRRLLEGSSDAAASSGALAAVLALLIFAGFAACFAMAGDHKQGKNSKPANQQDNRHEQNNARHQTERARNEPNKSSGDSVAGNVNGLRQDLVVYYSFDDDTNGKVYDESGNENHGVTVGDVNYEPSFRGRAARFTSNRTYIQSGSPGLNMHGWKRISVSVWCNTKRYTTYGRLISRGEVSGDGLSGIAMQAGSGSSKASFSIGRQFQNGPAIWEKLYTSSLQPRAMDRINQWVHLVGVFDGDRLRFYVNGKLDREVEASGHNLQLWDRPTHKLVIGNSSLKSRMAWGDKYFDGLVDEVKIWRRNLSAEEIKHVYHQGEQSISSRRIGELSQHARRLVPTPIPVLGQQTTGLDLSNVLRDSGQQRDVDAFTDDHRFFQRDVERLVKSKKTWALCALLDHKNVDAKILAARGLLQLADPQSVPVLLAAAKRNNYVVKGSEGATLHSIYRRTLKEALEKITGLELTSSERPWSTEEVDFAKVEDWVAEFISDTAFGIVDGNEVPTAIDLGKDAIRFEGHDADKVTPGLVAVGWYPVKTLPPAKLVLERHRKGEIPAGHAELVGRLPLRLSNFGMKGGSQLVVESFERKGSQISANVKYIRKYAKNGAQNAVYLRAKLPQNLPPGKYHVVLRFTSYIAGPKGEHVNIEKFGRPMGAMTCDFQVRGDDDVRPNSDRQEQGRANAPQREPALLAAAVANDDKAVKKLLEKGVNVNATATGEADEKNGYAEHNSPTLATALHWAAFHGNLRMARRLLEAGADIEAKDGRNWTPLYWSAGQDRRKVLQFLLEQRACVNFDQWSPLHLAANSDDIETLAALLKAGADPLARPKNDGRTPLDIGSTTNVIVALIDAIEDVETRDDAAKTVLCKEASYSCRPEVIERLLAKGANVESRDKNNETPLYKAVFLRRKEAVQVLLTAGADINAVNASGMTPLDVLEQQLATPVKGQWEDDTALAKRLKHTREFVAFLRQHGAKSKKPAVFAQFEGKITEASGHTSDDADSIPKHLRHWPGLYDRVAGEIVNAPEADVQVAKGYAKFADKGKVHNGRRVTIMTAKRNYALGEEVRVIHVLEAVKPGSQVYVMGPKAVYGEYVDGHCVTDDPPKWVDYNGRVLDSPAVDYNYVITKYNFKDLGEHTIQWKAAGPHDGKGLESNILRVTVGADDALAGKSPSVPGKPLHVLDLPVQVVVNSQKTLADAVGDGFLDESWTHPRGLVPTEFPKLEYVSGPTDKSLSPKSAWRKPIVLKHEDSGVVLHVNCYRHRDKPAAKVVKGVVGTPFAPHKEPDYQYEPLEFNDLRAATAAAEGRDVIVFRSGDVLYKVEARSGDAEGRKSVAADAAETIWQSQQTQ